ncbi:hypothetical protein P3T20_004064 [Paraburkholderia sp. GAS206C]|uniref:hypothetical protein n=1 Tax=unclassified Paraburkholderia TaxID=2615204 RepID=UPI003D2035C2
MFEEGRSRKPRTSRQFDLDNDLASGKDVASCVSNYIGDSRAKRPTDHSTKKWNHLGQVNDAGSVGLSDKPKADSLVDLQNHGATDFVDGDLRSLLTDLNPHIPENLHGRIARKTGKHQGTGLVASQIVPTHFCDRRNHANLQIENRSEVCRNRHGHAYLMIAGVTNPPWIFMLR